MRVPQHLRHGLGGQARDFPRIRAVLCGFVEHGQDQLTEWYGLSDVFFHVLSPFLVGAFRRRVPRRRGAFCLHTDLQQVPGHQFVGNEFRCLQRKTLFVLASSINLTYLSHQIEGEGR